METTFAVTWDYRCPFARNAHEHVLTALQAGAPWQVTFVPFSLTQVHVPEGELDAWDDPSKASSLLAMEAGIVVRDLTPERFFDVHRDLFAARHDHGRDLREPEVVAETLTRAGVDAGAVFSEIESGWPRATFRKEHADAAERHTVWGVPTFIAGDHAAFIRFMHRPEGDADVARRTIDRVLDLLVGWPELHEYKHTSLSR
jgi:protein-disulfide isomerase-like protein with CxxC motif